MPGSTQETCLTASTSHPGERCYFSTLELCISDDTSPSRVESGAMQLSPSEPQIGGALPKQTS